jgi:CelD/BcsL family acetyltransferase involved in cellulose biosynthesis
MIAMQLSITSNLAAIEHEWRRFEQHADCTPFQTFDWLSTWQRCIGSLAGVKPVIVTGHQCNGELLFILPLAIERAGFNRRCVFLGHTLCDYNAPLLAAEFPCMIGPPDFANWWHVIEVFLQKTQGYNYEVRLFDKMPERIGQQANPMLALSTTPNSDHAYGVYLGQDWEKLYAAKRSSATRSRDRTKHRRLADNGELRITTPDNPQERQSALKILFKQKGQFFAQHGVSNLFEQPGHSDFYLSIATKAGCLIHISRLEVGSKCVAANLGLQFRNRYYYVLASYDDGPLSRFGPGVIHLQELMRYAISRGFSYFDFTIGDHAYKREWADEEVQLHDHIAAVGWLGLTAAAQTTLMPRVKRFVKNSPSLWQLARRCKSVVGPLRSSIRGRSST